ARHARGLLPGPGGGPGGAQADQKARRGGATVSDVWDLESRLQDGRECLEAALQYLGLGWSVLALCPPDHLGVRLLGHSCDSPGKVPLWGWKEYQTRLATEAEVREWWRRCPTANVGVAFGPVSSLAGIDLDGPKAEARFRELS